jgi:NADH dehydrogenase (ubiquinone) Fe-S protein 5
VFRVLAGVLQGASVIFLTRVDYTEYDTLQCYANADKPSDCRVFSDDYLECLHHTKEVRTLVPRLQPAHTHHSYFSLFLLLFRQHIYSKIPMRSTMSFCQIARAKTVKAEFVRKAEHAAKEGRKAADILAEGAIVGVGLIQRDKSS